MQRTYNRTTKKTEITVIDVPFIVTFLSFILSIMVVSNNNKEDNNQNKNNTTYMVSVALLIFSSLSLLNYIAKFAYQFY